MSDGASLLLILIVLYLTDCVCFVNRHGVAFVRPWRVWRARPAGTRFGTSSGSPVGLVPLPLLGTVFRTRLWPVSLTAESVCAVSASTLSPAGRPPQSAAVLAYTDIRDVRADGADVRINDRLFVTTDTRETAGLLAALLNRLRATQPADRPGIIDRAMLTSLAPDTVTTEAERFQAGTRALRILCNAFWFYLFVVCPALTVTFGLLWLLIPLALIGLLFHVPTVVLFFLVHRRLLPEERSARTEHLFKMALCPPMAIRAVDAVTCHALARFHPVAVALALCPPADAAEFAGLYLRDLRHPMPLALDDAAKAIESDFRQRLARHIEAFLASRNVPLRALAGPPTRADDERAYCPRCLNRFTVEGGACPDCVEPRLIPFDRTQDKETQP